MFDEDEDDEGSDEEEQEQGVLELKGENDLEEGLEEDSDEGSDGDLSGNITIDRLKHDLFAEEAEGVQDGNILQLVFFILTHLVSMFRRYDNTRKKDGVLARADPRTRIRKCCLKRLDAHGRSRITTETTKFSARRRSRVRPRHESCPRHHGGSGANSRREDQNAHPGRPL